MNTHRKDSARSNLSKDAERTDGSDDTTMKKKSTSQENDESKPTSDVMPLAGVKVLELGSLVAGPYASALTAQFGAEVIKIEPPKAGDPLRKWRQDHEGTPSEEQRRGRQAWVRTVR